jgi:4-hydroxy-2-oxoheptanedioate aldolase
MDLKINKVKKRLQEGKVCFGTMLRILKSPQAVALCASEAWDYVVLDTEHNDFDLETLGNCSMVAKYEDLVLLVRVPDKLYHLMAVILDLGAEGLVLPQVKTEGETARIIQSVKYAPLGKRGVSISGIATRFRDCDQEQYTEWANRELLTVVQIESEEGLNNLPAILSVKGIDAIMIGPADLSQDMGIPGQLRHPRMEDAFREVISQCVKSGVAPGIHFGDIELVRKWITEGMRFVTYSYDTKFFKDASRQALQELHAIAKY